MTWLCNSELIHCWFAQLFGTSLLVRRSGFDSQVGLLSCSAHRYRCGGLGSIAGSVRSVVQHIAIGAEVWVRFPGRFAQLFGTSLSMQRSGFRFLSRSNRHIVANSSPPLRRVFGAVLPRRLSHGDGSRNSLLVSATYR